MNISVMGAGAWGTAVAKVLAEKFNSRVMIWSYEGHSADDINLIHENKRYLANIKLPSNLIAVRDLVEATENADYIFIVTPSIYILDILKNLNTKSVFTRNPKLAILTKGFVNLNNKIFTIVEASEQILPNAYKDNITYITGPSHAEEVGRGILTGLVAASRNKSNAYEFINLFKETTLFLFYTEDVKGVQIAAALKNVFSIAFGILNKYKEQHPNYIGSNTESLFFSIALNDMSKIGFDFGALDFKTFIFLAGSGDLDVTCRSIFGRNVRFGRDIIEKNILTNFKDIDDLVMNINKIGYLPEGVLAAKYCKLLFQQVAYNTKSDNLANIVYKILNKEASPQILLNYINHY